MKGDEAGLLAHLIARQALFDVRSGRTAKEAAKGYFTVADRFDFDMEVHSVDEDEVEFSFLRCPAGYTEGERMRICMATNKWDRECVRVLGGRMVMDELIPEGNPTCHGYIVADTKRVSDEQRRYPRGTV